MIDHRTLGKLAAEAFALGLKHGGTQAGPIDSARLAAFLRMPGVRLTIERRKIRQVYGAAFDIAATHRRIEARRAKEEAREP